MIGSLGFPEIILIFVVVLLLFGPKKLPDFAKTFGKAIKEFRKTVSEAKSTIEEELEKSDLKDLDVTEDLKQIDSDIKDLNKEIKSIGSIDMEDDGKKK